MKLGRRKLEAILSAETGIPKDDILIYGVYHSYGNKEQLVIGGHTIVALNGNISISEPSYKDDKVGYKTRVIKGGVNGGETDA